MKRCAIVGASGHGKVVADLAELAGYECVTFFDDRWPNIESIEHWRVIGTIDSLVASIAEYDAILIAIGDNHIRSRLSQKLSAHGAIMPSLVHPSAVLSKYANVGAGSVIMAGTIINPFASIGSGCIVNTGSTIDHDCVLSNWVHVSPGANLAGQVEVGECAWVGMGSSVKQCVKIGENVVVGAGATVVNDIPANQTVVGTPAKSISRKLSN